MGADSSHRLECAGHKCSGSAQRWSSATILGFRPSCRGTDQESVCDGQTATGLLRTQWILLGSDRSICSGSAVERQSSGAHLSKRHTGGRCTCSGCSCRQSQIIIGSREIGKFGDVCHSNVGAGRADSGWGESGNARVGGGDLLSTCCSESQRDPRNGDISMSRRGPRGT